MSSIGMIGTVSLRAGTMDCWSCGCETTIITGVDLSHGSEQWRLTVAQFDDFPDLFAALRPHIPSGMGIGPIERRFSNTMQCAYLSNGCAHCGALLGKHYEHHAWAHQTAICKFAVRLTERWRQAVAKAIGEEPDWMPAAP